MSDDVTLGEIARGQEAIRAQLSRLIGRDEYVAFQQLLELRFKEQADDIAELKGRISASETQRWQVRLAMFSGIVAPFLVAMLLLFVQSQGVK